MKHLAALLLALTVTTPTSAQNGAPVGVEANGVGATQAGDSALVPQVTPLELADEACTRYFILKNGPISNIEERGTALLQAVSNYVQSTEQLTPEQKEQVKAKLKLLRPELEDLGVYHSSTGYSNKAYPYIEAFLNIPHLPIFDGEQFGHNTNYNSYSTYVLFAANIAHNLHNWESAVSFYKEYLELGEKQGQETCYRILTQDLYRLKQHDEAAHFLEEGLMNYPNSIGMLKLSIQLNIDQNNLEKAKQQLDKAVTLAPYEQSLQITKADLEFANEHYATALPIYIHCYQTDPGNHHLQDKLALCHYNLAAQVNNQMNTVTDAAAFQQLRDSAQHNFHAAISLINTIEQQRNGKVGRNLLYVLADSYQLTGQPEMAAATRQRVDGVQMQLAQNEEPKAEEKVPNFNDWYRPQLEQELKRWEQRGEFEPAEQYAQRVNPEKRQEQIAIKRKQLEERYLKEYASTYNIDDLTMKGYDPDHETFCIKTLQGNLYLHVPLRDEQPQKFKESWNAVRITNPVFKVDKQGKIQLAKATFTTPHGIAYAYDASLPLVYQKIKVAKPEWNDDDLMLAQNNGADDNKPTTNVPEQEELNVGESIVDIDVPKTKEVNSNTFALIIANENYDNVGKVPFALNDGNSFRRYCTDLLGIPQENIVQRKDATGNQMIDAIDKIKNYARAYTGMKLLVFYSGHGLPDPSSNEAYLLPTDASPHNINTGYKLSRFYKELAAGNPSSITVFIDACFSGAKKDGTVMDTSARGVVIAPREETPVNNMVVFSACTGSETAYPYKNERHGLFTFFLLKKLKEDKGRTPYQKLADYIADEVKKRSLRLNGKIQTPQVQTSLPLSEWGGWRLDKEK